MTNSLKIVCSERLGTVLCHPIPPIHHRKLYTTIPLPSQMSPTPPPILFSRAEIPLHSFYNLLNTTDDILSPRAETLVKRTPSTGILLARVNANTELVWGESADTFAGDTLFERFGALREGERVGLGFRGWHGERGGGGESDEEGVE